MLVMTPNVIISNFKNRMMIPTDVHTFGMALKSEDGYDGDFKAMSLLLGDFVGRDSAEHRPRSSSGPNRRQFNLRYRFVGQLGASEFNGL